ncbi:DUF3369 domain-containing protein [Sulfurospirillum arcachonense]|uniref:DUF3369 domain-containing protein n=1 Tax=Sulfurospirillum arcachonense TaxID=57666 RepID=UPI0004682EAD|nr:DUF3369 domain-containing protein [Sulfurospirillum arcachonense]
MAMMKFVQKKKEENLSKATCKVLIVDDEEEVHLVTRTVLGEFTFEGKKLEILSAYSGEEALELLSKQQDIQLILLDVVMESDDAGLIVAKKIREELGLKKIRIVLRTGQPGSAPEKEVIDNYDINDYKEKTELTSKKLYTTVIASLRAYRDMDIIDHNRRALEKIIEASKTIFKLSSFYMFVEAALSQVTAILNIDGHIFETEADNGFFATLHGEEFKLIASIGSFKGQNETKILTKEILSNLNRAYTEKKSFFEKDFYVTYFEASSGKILFLYVEGCSRLEEVDKRYLQVFASNLEIAFNNICINNGVKKQRQDFVEELGEVLIGKKVFVESTAKSEIVKLCEEKKVNSKLTELFLEYFDIINRDLED